MAAGPGERPAQEYSKIGDTGDPPGQGQPVKQVVRALSVKNNTGGKLTVYLQYRTQAAKGDWQWFPANPGQAKDALSFTVDAGQEASFQDKNATINASRVRIWAVSEKNEEWNEYKNKDLWLVPEIDADKQHSYIAPAIELFTHTLSR